MIYLELLLGFLKVGLFSFGGAYSAIPLIREVVLSHGWLSDEMLTHMIAVSESTPGPIMVNMATYIGSSQGGVLGALIATTAVVLPAFMIILLVISVLKRAIDRPWMQNIMAGIVPCVIGIILFTGVQMEVGNIVQTRDLLLAAVLAVILFGTRYVWKKKLSPIMLIMIAAVMGAAVYGI